jgi:hypothetical protein
VGKDGKVYSYPKTTVVFSDDFENGHANWYFPSGYQQSHWAIVNDASKSATHSLGFNLNGRPDGTDKDRVYLASKQTLSGSDFRSASLEFQNRYTTPIDNGGRISNLYHYWTTNNSSYGGPVVTYQTRTGLTQGWTLAHFDLNSTTPTAEFNMLYRVYAVQNYNARTKWWIDDVYINKTVYAATKIDYPSGGGSAVLNGVAFVPGADMAAIVGDDGVAWKFSAGALTKLTTNTAEDLRSISFKPQNKTALVVGDNGKVQLYNSTSNAFTNLTFINSTASLWDVVYRQDHSTTGQSPDCSQALIVGSGGGAWQYFGYDGHFEQVSTGTQKTLYGAAYNNTRWPLYGPGLVVGHGSSPVVLKDTSTLTHRPFIVNFYKGNASASWSSNYLGQVTVAGGLAPDPYPPYDSKVIVSFLWKAASPAGDYNVTARVDITNNESAKPANPDRVNEVDEWYNNQLSSKLTLVPEFNEIIAPLAGTVIIVLAIRRKHMKRRARKRKSRASKTTGP